MGSIRNFLKGVRSRDGGPSAWLKWREDGKVLVWLHKLVEPAACWSHQFQMLEEGEDRETGKTKQFLRYPRFVSPDPEIVHANQFLYEKSSDERGYLRVVPDRDPFLLLREWLRYADHIGLDETIFRWVDPAPRGQGTIEWTRGELSRLVKRGKSNFGHSLDTRLDYLFVVVDHDDPGKGLQVARESQMLAKKIGRVIERKMETLGEQAGDPAVNPYPIVWSFSKGRDVSPQDMYDAYAHDGISEVPPDILELIESEEVPDIARFCVPQDGDQEKIRAAFEAAAQVDLPLDAIFSDDEGERRSVLTLPGGKRPLVNRGAKPADKPAGKPAQSTKTTPAPAPQTTAAPQGGRRRLKQPDPPAVEMIPCDKCQKPLAVTATRCECGAEYEVDDPEPPTKAPAPQQVPKQPPTSEKRKAGGETPVACFQCEGAVVDGTCVTCGLAQDEIPF